MKTFYFLLLFAGTAAQIPAVSISTPNNGISHSRRDRWKQTPDSREINTDWKPNDTRRPSTGQSGWQFHPSNKWKAPRDAKDEKRRDYEKTRRQHGTSRLRVD